MLSEVNEVGRGGDRINKDVKVASLVDDVLTISSGRYIDIADEVYAGNDALQYVMSTNLKRRHLTDSQKAIVGRRYKVYYAKQYPQGKHHKELIPGESRDRAGEVVGVSG